MEPGEHHHSERDDQEESPLFVPHHKPFGKHRLIWGKGGDRFPKTCMLGPDWPCLFLSFILIWGVTLGTLIGIGGGGSLWMYLVTIASLLLVTLLLCGAGFSDPGILPKRERAIGSRDCSDLPATDSRTGYTLCSACLVYRPMGTFHCRDCDACILELDRTFLER